MSRNAFASIRTEGALFTPDFLQRLTTAGGGLGGLTPDSYHLAGEQVHEAASRAWNRLIGAWTAFRAASAALAKEDAATTVTRERWLLPLFAELGFGRLQATKAIEIGGRSYPVSHAWHQVPLHLVGCAVPLDTRTTGVAGAARTSPHGLVQELLNRNDGMLWGVVSNGLTLRVLRDNRSLTRQAYVEFDLVSMMDGQAYADFVALWLLCHQSRFEGDRPEDCWLERWASDAHERGTRALDDLRDGVEQAIAALGRGFLAHPANRALVEQLRTGALERQDYYRQLLRVVYRLIFLFVAEDRDLLLVPTAATTARERYRRYYSVSRLRDLAAARRGTPHADLWAAITVVFHALGGDGGCQELGLPALGSFLWRSEAVTQLKGCSLANADLLDAVRALGFRVERNVRRLVDWRNLGPEELGSVYESLLELYPDVNTSAGTFTLRVAAGHERKTTGSYYTPTSLIECLLDSALDPVLDEAATQPDPARAILALKVCDPACGSGHFLIAAAHRIANRLATVRIGDPEPAPEAIRAALRDVIGHCLYGVDVNPMAVELCKVNLWLEALEPGRPLSFLDHHIQCGNALLGAAPLLLRRGIPDEAFDPIEGDDKDVCQELKKRNKKERDGFRSLFTTLAPRERVQTLAADAAAVDSIEDTTPEGVRQKEARYASLLASEGYATEKLVADAWCAAFMQRRAAGALVITEDVFRTIERDQLAVPSSVRAEVAELSADYGFLHWHVAFPNVFRVSTATDDEKGEGPGWNGGFDVVLGNPPWERINVNQKEWFAARNSDIADSLNVARRRSGIAALRESDPILWATWSAAQRRAQTQTRFARGSGRFPLCAHGDINSYGLFAELNRSLVSSCGAVGCILPSGIATDNSTRAFFATLMDRAELRAFWEFENVGFFSAGHGHMLRFALVTFAGEGRQERAPDFFFQGHSLTELSDQERHFTLSADDVGLINPNTRTCPIFRTRRDAEITKAVYRKYPVLQRDDLPVDENPWLLGLGRTLHMGDDAPLFKTRQALEAEGAQLSGNVFVGRSGRMLPLYEARMIYQFDHRYGDFQDSSTNEREHRLPEVDTGRLRDPSYVPMPFYWVPEHEVETRLERRGWAETWLMGWRDVTDARASLRTVVASVFPRTGTSDKLPLILARTNPASLLATLSSFVFDYCARQKLGGVSLKQFVFKQLPVPLPTNFELAAPWDMGTTFGEWIQARVLELVYTAWDLKGFAHEMNWDGPPFGWDPARRDLLRAELDAALFHLYGIPFDDVDYIMETFPVVRRADEKAHGEYRTKRVILEIYDEMQRAIETRVPYKARLDPPPADPRVAHPAQVVAGPHRLDDFTSLPNGAWALPTVDWTEAVLPILAAVLKSQGGPMSSRDVRLASALALEPRLLTPSLDAETAAQWLRLVGQDAAPLPLGVHAFAPPASTAWGAAVKQLRGTGRLIEDARKNTWSAGPALESIDTTTWPDGRAGFVWRAIRQRGVDLVLDRLPHAVRAWVNAEAA